MLKKISIVIGLLVLNIMPAWAGISITSPAFKHNQSIPDQYTCRGRNVNPPLAINGVPESAQSLILIVNDPDAPDGDWIHWAVYNISPYTRFINEDSLPGTAIPNDFKTAGYGGPCPPSGTHRYVFSIYALSKILPQTKKITLPQLKSAIKEHGIAQGRLIGTCTK